MPVQTRCLSTEELLHILVRLYVDNLEVQPGIPTTLSKYRIESLIKLIEKPASITEESLPELNTVWLADK